MKNPTWIAVGWCFLGILATNLLAAELASGWRGNATGLWPNAKAPLQWQRLAHGALEGMRAQANRPTLNEAGDAPAVRKGLIAEWLVLGPFSVRDSVENPSHELQIQVSKPTPALVHCRDQRDIAACRNHRKCDRGVRSGPCCGTAWRTLPET